MKIRTMAAAAAALSLAAAPAVAQINLDRTAAPVEGESEGAGPPVIIGVLAVTAIIVGALIAGDVIEEDGDPVSP